LKAVTMLVVESIMPLHCSQAVPRRHALTMARAATARCTTYEAGPAAA